MRKKKKYNRSDPEVTIIMIDKALEKHVVKLKDVKNKDYNGKFWYQHFKFDTYDDYLKWRNWCKDFLMNKVKPSFTEKEFNSYFPWFDMQFGLGVKKEDEDKLG